MKAVLKESDLRRKVADVVMQYNWLTRDDGKRMLGWLACALACKCMKHRPHVWFSGYPGKTWFMNRIQHAVHQGHYKSNASPIHYRARSGQLLPQVIDMTEFRDTNDQIIASSRRKVQKVINACRAASGHVDHCGGYGPLSFSACLMSWHQPDLTRYETRQFAPVRVGAAMNNEDFIRYETEVSTLFGQDGELALELQQSILESADEIARLADKLDHDASKDGSDGPHQIEISAIRGALSAGWQWWSGTDEVLGYWQGERPIRGAHE